ncbi:unnamed protein product [Vicia faba]|uniref:Uncharacterized protein n=1 Tax=Vicia faba TaxID=3906 RepID=A0AAV1AMI6_VICFA|nr:unnamed protein product [Vicia faba]
MYQLLLNSSLILPTFLLLSSCLLEFWNGMNMVLVLRNLKQDLKLFVAFSYEHKYVLISSISSLFFHVLMNDVANTPLISFFFHVLYGDVVGMEKLGFRELWRFVEDNGEKDFEKYKEN